MNLIARFVFDKGDPVDVRLNSLQKDEFLTSIRDGKPFHDEEGEGVFYANIDHARFFYISKETLAPIDKIEEEPSKDVVGET